LLFKNSRPGYLDAGYYFYTGLKNMFTPISRKKVIDQWHYVKNAEVTFQCPACFAMETLLFEEGKLVNTRRWTQTEGNIYHHNCGKPAQPFSSAKGWILSNNSDYLLLTNARGKNQKKG
jgi:hypothetical protein